MPARHRPEHWRSPALIALGLLIACAALLKDVLQPGLLDFGLKQTLVVLAGVLLALEGAVQGVSGSGGGMWPAITSGTRLGTVVAYSVAALVMTTLLYAFRGYFVDDAYITFRYARHLALGFGVTWNPGEAPVEGYSNFLWMVLSAAAIRVGFDPLIAARVLGMACHVATAFALRPLALQLGASPRTALLPVVLYAAVPAFAFWSGSGLETASVVLLSVLYLTALAREEAHDGTPWRSALCAVLLVLSRPDGAFLVALSLVPLLFAPRPHRFAWIARFVALAAPPILAYAAWKWHAFGTLVPNTLAAKARPLAGLGLSIDFLSYAFPLLVLALLRAARAPLSLAEQQVLAVAAGFLIAAVDVAPQVAHYHRFFLPALAPLLALVAALAQGAVEHSGTRRRRAVWTAVAGALAVVYVMAPVFAMKTYADLEARGLATAHQNIGRMLGLRFGPSSTLAASDCGIVPYLSEMRTIDLWGLTDRTIATQGFSTRYVLARDPDVVILHSLFPERFRGRESYDAALYSSLDVGGRYRVCERVPFFGYWMWVFERRPPA